MGKKITRPGHEEHGAGKLPFSACLVYPNRREVGMSYLGFHKIYAALAARCDCDVAFLPEGGGKALSHFSRRPLDSFGLLAFSLTFEMDAPNVLAVLTAAGLPPEARKRGDRHPLVCAGGIVPTLNPEPYAAFFDFMVLGEGEITLREWLEKLSASAGRPRAERLEAIAPVEGVYVPSLYDVRHGAEGRIASRRALGGAPERVKRLYDPAFGESGSAQDAALGDTVFRDSWLIETGKGCGQGCRFCAAGYIYRPVRHVRTERLFAQVDEGLARKKRIGLIGSAICEHPAITRVYDYILEKGGGLNVSSLRLGYVDRPMLDRLVQGGLRTMTIAPEAGSERLRRALNKDVGDDEVVSAAGEAADAGMLNVKMYFLFGLPGETDEDVLAIIALVQRVRDEFVEKSKRHGRAGKITAALNPFVPKAQTPFQWEPLAPLASLKARSALVKKGLARESNVELKVESPRNAAAQAVLSVGGREVAALVMEAFADGGWNRALKSDLARRAYAARRERDEMLPWDFIDSGYAKGYLWKEYERSLAGNITPPCPPELTGCRRCGEFKGNCF